MKPMRSSFSLGKNWTDLEPNQTGMNPKYLSVNQFENSHYLFYLLNDIA